MTIEEWHAENARRHGLSITENRLLEAWWLAYLKAMEVLLTKTSNIERLSDIATRAEQDFKVRLDAKLAAVNKIWEGFPSTWDT
jgi:hypothetical protein